MIKEELLEMSSIPMLESVLSADHALITFDIEIDHPITDPVFHAKITNREQLQTLYNLCLKASEEVERVFKDKSLSYISCSIDPGDVRLQHFLLKIKDENPDMWKYWQDGDTEFVIVSFPE